jgi:hypothetical protein
VREGLAGDDWAVTRGLQRAHPGGKVEPKRVVIEVSEVAPAKADSDKTRE